MVVGGHGDTPGHQGSPCSLNNPVTSISIIKSCIRVMIRMA